MAENLSDFDLRESPDALPPSRFQPPSPKAATLWVVIGLTLVAIGLAVYFFFFTNAPPAEEAATTAPKPAATTSDPKAALGRDPMDVELPPLDQSDLIVRKLVSGLSSHPTVAAWLATDGLIRNFTVVVSNIAEDDRPAVHVARLRPAGRFEVVERNGKLVIDPRSYQRYNQLTAAIQSIDPDGAARLYATLKPLIEQAHRDLGYGNTSFDATLERAIAKLLATPALRDPVAVVPKGIGYGYEDARIEALTPAQKHLLRFGPNNVQVVKQALRNIAVALGISKDRLPG
jgi:hypothetical protein